VSIPRREIKLQFQLGAGDFGKAGQDTVTFDGLRCSVDIVHGGIATAQADVQVWGMPLALMNQLTVTQKTRFEQQHNNRLTIWAGDGETMAIAFVGDVMEAWADGRQAPDVAFHVTAATGLIDLGQTIPPTSFRGSVGAALALEQIAGQINYTFENNGVDATLTSPYKPGSPQAQIESICADIGCEYTIDGINKVVAIWPRGSGRPGDIVISPETGMIGYPSFSQGGIQVSTLFNPNLTFGRKFRVESEFTPAKGEWKVYGLFHFFGV